MPSYQYLAVTGGFGLAKVNFTGTTGTDHAQIEFAYKSTPIIGPAHAQADANTWNTILQTWLLTWISDLVEMTGVDIVLNNGTSIVEASSNNGSMFGREAGALLPPNVCILMRKQSGLLGKENRGRVYLPGVSESLVDTPSTISHAHLVAMQADMDSMFAALVAAELLPYLIRKTNVPLDNYSVPLTNFLVENLFATQRRRLRKASHG
jgi:hypothetical protein